VSVRRGRSWLHLGIALPLFGVAVWLASRISRDFDDPRRAVIETVAMMVLAAPLLTWLRWRGRSERDTDNKS